MEKLCSAGDHAEKQGDLSEEHTELKEEAVCPYCGYIDDCSYEHFQSHETEKDARAVKKNSQLK